MELIFMKRNNLIVLMMVAFVSLVSHVWACGPEFDSAYLVRASKSEFLAVPEGSFLFEVERIAGKGFYQTPPEPSELVKSVVDKDAADLEMALNESGLSAEDKSAVHKDYKAARREIADHLENSLIDIAPAWYGAHFRNSGIVKLKVKTRLNEKTPEEFKLYMQGARAYYAADYKGAVKAWKDLLALPAKDRQYRSVWASFMIAKTYLNQKKQKESVEFFELTRKLASDGFKDSLSLSADTYGWQALAEFETKQYVTSIHNYLKARDLNSLSRVSAKLLELKANELKSIVNDDQARGVLLGWAVSRPNGFGQDYDFTQKNKESSGQYGELLKAVESLGENKAIDNADHIAWIYYNKGNMANTKRWLTLAKGKTNMAQYIEAKLMLRDGKVDDAIAKLGLLAKSFESSPEKDMFYDENIVKEIHSELGVLSLSRKEYISALDLLLKGRHWEDIAYVAEKVLTSAELELYLRQNPTKKEMFNKQVIYSYGYAFRENDLKRHPEHKDWYGDDEKDGVTVYQALAHLLARKFVREGQWEKAIEFMPETYAYFSTDVVPDAFGVLNYSQKSEKINLKEKVKELQGLLKTAENKVLPVKQRAKAYYEAGVLVRTIGMELTGTELDPDGFTFSGSYEYFDAMIHRFAIMTKQAQKSYVGWQDDYIKEIKAKRDEMSKKRDYFFGGADEELRAVSSLPTPNLRYHYRYKAAQLHWKAAELLPDNDELKAKALFTGGTYIKVLDPKEAEKFYKALVKNCPETKLGEEARKLKWFPKLERI